MALSGGGKGDAEVKADSLYSSQDAVGCWGSGGNKIDGFMKGDSSREAAWSRRDGEDREGGDGEFSQLRREAIGGRLSGVASFRRSEDPAIAIRVPSSVAFDDESGAGKRWAARNSSYAEGVSNNDGLGNHIRKSVVSSLADDRRHHGQEGVVTEEVGGGAQGGVALGSSGGSTASVCSSSQRLGMKRLELRNPAEEGAVRKVVKIGMVIWFVDYMM